MSEEVPTTDTADETEEHDDGERASRRSRTGMSPPILMASMLFSVVVGLLVAWFLIGPSSEHDDPTISAKQLLSGSADSPVQVSGTARVGLPVPKAGFTYMTGVTGSFAAFQGTPLVVNFWASTCAPCIREMPTLQHLAQQYADRAQFLGIDVGDSMAAGQKMLDTTKVTYPQARDPKSELVAAFGGTALPDTVVIDQSGTVTGIYNHALTDTDVTAIEHLLGGG